jgi:hypothetical protein
MKDFNELQSLWNNQKDAEINTPSDEIITIANNKLKKVKQQHFFTIGILLVTAIVLVCYYLWIDNANTNGKLFGLKMMIIVLVIRILLEIMSILKFKNIKLTASLTQYSTQLISFYQLRKIIHYVLTPIIYFSYCYGFILMLPLFKANLSTGFYNYIISSGVFFLVFFSFILYRTVKSDIENLNYLKNLE